MASLIGNAVAVLLVCLLVRICAGEIIKSSKSGGCAGCGGSCAGCSHCSRVGRKTEAGEPLTVVPGRKKL